MIELNYFITESLTIYPVNVGLTMPGIVANVFEMPMSTLACCGAISKWFTLWNMDSNRLIK